MPVSAGPNGLSLCPTPSQQQHPCANSPQQDGLPSGGGWGYVSSGLKLHPQQRSPSASPGAPSKRRGAVECELPPLSNSPIGMSMRVATPGAAMHQQRARQLRMIQVNAVSHGRNASEATTPALSAPLQTHAEAAAADLLFLAPPRKPPRSRPSTGSRVPHGAASSALDAEPFAIQGTVIAHQIGLNALPNGRAHVGTGPIVLMDNNAPFNLLEGEASDEHDRPSPHSLSQARGSWGHAAGSNTPTRPPSQNPLHKSGIGALQASSSMQRPESTPLPPLTPRGSVVGVAADSISEPLLPPGCYGISTVLHFTRCGSSGAAVGGAVASSSSGYVSSNDESTHGCQGILTTMPQLPQGPWGSSVARRRHTNSSQECVRPLSGEALPTATDGRQQNPTDAVSDMLGHSGQPGAIDPLDQGVAGSGPGHGASIEPPACAPGDVLISSSRSTPTRNGAEGDPCKVAADEVKADCLRDSGAATPTSARRSHRSSIGVAASCEQHNSRPAWRGGGAAVSKSLQTVAPALVSHNTPPPVPPSVPLGSREAVFFLSSAALTASNDAWRLPVMLDPNSSTKRDKRDFGELVAELEASELDGWERRPSSSDYVTHAPKTEPEAPTTESGTNKAADLLFAVQAGRMAAVRRQQRLDRAARSRSGAGAPRRRGGAGRGSPQHQAGHTRTRAQGSSDSYSSNITSSEEDSEVGDDNNSSNDDGDASSVHNDDEGEKRPSDRQVEGSEEEEEKEEEEETNDGEAEEQVEEEQHQGECSQEPHDVHVDTGGCNSSENAGCDEGLRTALGSHTPTSPGSAAQPVLFATSRKEPLVPHLHMPNTRRVSARQGRGLLVVGVQASHLLHSHQSSGRQVFRSVASGSGAVVGASSIKLGKQ